MAQYIDKDALVAEIDKRWRSLANKNYKANGKYDIEISTLLSIKSFIDTLEVKEVDLEKEIEEHLKECLDVKFPTTDIEIIKKDVAYTAKKFFELGIKTIKRE